MKRLFFRVQKEAWDALWHAYYYRGGKLTYDRVEQAKAIKISRALVWEEDARK